jgi:cyclophilin family peptidyl-prolyl cis-trans isomerase
MKPLTILSAVVGTALLLAACGGATDTTTTSTTEIPGEIPLEIVPSNYAQFRAQPTACGATAPAPVTEMQFATPADESVDPDAANIAVISTSCGDITVELDASLAPETVNSFVFLTRQGYFDGTVFHRVIPGFVVQGGDQTATGLGGPGYSIPDEFPPPTMTYERGTLAMANAGPGTTGSQFFIVLDDVGLPPQFTIFGHVTEGLDVLDLLQAVPLGAAPTSPDPTPSTPLETIYIDTLTIES